MIMTLTRDLTNLNRRWLVYRPMIGYAEPLVVTRKWKLILKSKETMRYLED